MMKNKRWIPILIAVLFWTLVFHAIEKNMENTYLKWFLFSYFCVATSHVFARQKVLKEFFEENKKQELYDEYHEDDKENFVKLMLAQQKGVDAAKSGNYHEAVDIFSKCINADESNWRLLIGRAYAYNQLRQHDKALSDVYSALALDHSISAVHGAKADIEWNMGNLQSAISDYTKAISIDPDDSINFTNRGQIKRDIGDLDGALDDLNHALNLDPENSLAKQVLTLCQTMKELPEVYKGFLEKRANNTATE